MKPTTTHPSNYHPSIFIKNKVSKCLFVCSVCASNRTASKRLPPPPPAQCVSPNLTPASAASLGWVGLGVTTGRGSKTRSKIFSLASNHQFTHFDFTSGGVIPGKIPHHSHMCTGEFTQTGLTLTVFFYQEYPG